MKYLYIFIVLAFVSGESSACRSVIIDINAELKAAKNVAVAVITSASSNESVEIIAKEFETQSSKTDSDEDKILIGCDVCYSSYQNIQLKVSSQKTIKGKPNLTYDFEFRACRDESEYSLFSKVVVFDYGEGGRNIYWQLLDDENTKLLDSYIESDN